MMQDIAIIGDHRPAKSIDQTSEKIINWYINMDMSDVHNPRKVLYPTKGLPLFLTLPGSNHRGATTYESYGYAVVGQTFYRFDSLGAYIIVGTLRSAAGQVNFTSIQDYIVMVDGSSGYVYQISTQTFTEITAPSFPYGATSITSQDGYVGVNVPGTQNFQLSDNSDPLTWNALRGGSASAEAEDLICIKSFRRDWWVMGAKAIEPWYDDGTNQFEPFLRRDGALLSYGLHALNSVATSKDSMCLLARASSGLILPVMVKDYQIVPIFNKDIRQQIANFQTTTDAIGFIDAIDDIEFYVITFPSENKTFAYDLSTVTTNQSLLANSGTSHERNSYVNGTFIRWRPQWLISFGGSTYAGDYHSGNIYKLDENTYTDNGQPIIRTLRSPAFLASNQYQTIYKLQLNFETNQALTAGQGSNPMVMTKFSRDGGHTFGPEQFRTLGTLGEFNDVVIYNSLGQARKWCMELSVSDPIKWILLGATVDSNVGLN